MKTRAIIYTRVSTDEQNNGYSPADQKDKLFRHCENHNIEVVGFYHDDESGKTFDRPAWKKILNFIKKNRGGVDNILFLKWDRFSRNVAEAYITIKNLRKYEVEAQSIEQPLDFEIPESKIMLAIYLAAPEVDNDRRALNIFHGMRRGRKEGRWLGACLRGYKNTRDENNRPVMTPEGGQQEFFIRKAFTEFATGLYNIEELRHKLNKEGFKCNRSSFWKFLRNRGYIGQVFISAYKDETAQWIPASHQAIIDEKIFYAVQEILENKRKKLPNKFMMIRDEFPLRGFLICPRCGKTLTASTSIGKMKTKFQYYHCSKGCKERHPVAKVDFAFLELLQSINANPQSMKLYAAILTDHLSQSTVKGKSELKKLAEERTRQNLRLKNARDLMLDGEISSNEFKEMKYSIEETIFKISIEESKVNTGFENANSKIQDCLKFLTSIDHYYTTRDTATKQRIVSSIFPGKLIFENNKVRTLRINSVVPLICRAAKGFREMKKGKKIENDLLSLQVDPQRIELWSKQALNMLSTCVADY